MSIIQRNIDEQRPTKVPPNLCALAVMTKAPRAGHVKTRLTPPFTAEEAADLNRCFLRDTASSISIAAAKGLARGLAVYTPADAAAEYVGLVPAEFGLLPQRGDSLSERIMFALEDIFSLGFSSVCLINSDSPTLPPEVFEEAANVLARPEKTLVLGPSSDGGFYLIGLRNIERTLFADIAWSTDRVLQQTIERARQIKLKVHFLPTWFDVDDSKTLRRLCEELFAPAEGIAAGFSASATREFLAGIIESEGRERIWPIEEPQ